MTNGTPAAPQSAGSAAMRQKTRWAVLGVVVLILIVGGWLLWSGKLGIDISQYFAYETPGYVPPNCGWHGDKIAAEDYRYCCPEMDQIAVPWSGLAPTVPPEREVPIDQDCVPVPECAYDDPPCAVDLMPGVVLCPTPTPPARLLPLQYCVVPGCEAVARAVQCVKAPCEPIVEISCPPGTVIPPRPEPIPGDQYDVSLNSGNPVVVGSTVTIAWKYKYGSLPSELVSFELHKRGWGENRFVIMEDVENTGRYLWDTNRELVNTENGAQQVLGEMTGDDLYLYMLNEDGRIVGVVSSFTLLEESPPPPSGEGAGIWIGEPSERPQAVMPGQTVFVPVFLVTEGVSVTAVELDVLLQGPGDIVGATYQTPYFPDELVPAGVGSQRFTVTLGSGVGGGVRADEPIEIARLTVIAFPDAPVGEHISIRNTPGTQIAVEEYEGNAFRMSGGSNLLVTDVPRIPGDADGDGDIDIFDYSLVITHFGTPGPEGDVNGDGIVDIFDYAEVIENFLPKG